MIENKNELNSSVSSIKMTFQESVTNINFDKIALTKNTPPYIFGSINFKRIVASVSEVGVIEPLVVFPILSTKAQYILLDGHLRLLALKKLGKQEAPCLIATEDESYTYNRHINRLPTIQEHKMIVKAIERGVSEKRLAKALNMDIRSVNLKKSLLDGICRETAELLKDKMVAVSVFSILRRMKNVRQVEVAMLMNDANLYTLPYARALFAATPNDQLIQPAKAKQIKGLGPDQIMRMESEMENIQREYRLIEENFAPDVYNLTLIQAWLAKLIKNSKIERYLNQNYNEVLSQFQKIIDIKSLGASATK